MNDRDIEFERERGKMDYKRLNNNYFHVCAIIVMQKICSGKKDEDETSLG